jgi:probable HAF family extracellular repeat protein
MPTCHSLLASVIVLSPRRRRVTFECKGRRRDPFTIALLALALTVLAAAQGMSAPFAITDLGTLGGTFGVATAINDVGHVVGHSATAEGATHAFLWQSGTMTDLGSLSGGGGDSYATGINNLDQVVGYSTTADGTAHAVLWQSGTMTDMNSLIPAESGWVLRVATAINEVGQIVGWGAKGGQPRAFRWQSGTVTDLGTLGGDSSASAINDLGQVVGYSITAEGAAHAFLWQSGAMTDLGTLSTTGGDSYATGINNLGQVVGYSTTDFIDDFGITGPHAFVWQDGQMTDLHFSLTIIAHESYAMGINNAGQVVGWSSDFLSGCAILYPTDLNSLIPADSGWVLDGGASAINDAGQIVGAGGPGTRAFLLSPSPLASLRLDPTTVVPGTSSTGTVTLTTAAPEGGAVIALSSSNTAIATAPAAVIVPAGATSAMFTVSTNSASTSTSVTLSTTYAGFTASAVLTVIPETTLSAVRLNLASVQGGSPSIGTVTLSAAAPTGGAAIGLASSDAAVAATPASVTVAAGVTSATFTISTTPVTASTAVTISGTYGGLARSAVLTVTPPTLSSVSLNPTGVSGGASSIGTVTLSGPAPAGGAGIALSSSDAAIAVVPAGVTVPAGATSTMFPVSTSACASGTVTITAASGGASRSAALTVTTTPDTVAIQIADYFRKRQLLRVEATSTTSTAALSVYETSSGAFIGTLTRYNGSRYRGEFTWPLNPRNITVRSTLCGWAATDVALK